MREGSKLLAVGSWLLIAVFVCGIAAPIFWSGGRETVIDLSPSAYFLIVSMSVVAGLSAIVWLIQASRPGSLDATLVLLRRSRPGMWWLRILALAGTIAAVVALFAWMWVEVSIPHLPGAVTFAKGEVVGLVRAGSEQACQYLIEVELSEDRRVPICAEFGIVMRTIPPELQHLKRGDAVQIAIRATTLGKVVTIVGRLTR